MSSAIPDGSPPTARVSTRDGPQLACVVLSLRDQPELLGAVHSLMDQSERPEIVVVNSGGGDASRRTKAAGFDVVVVNHSAPLLPGGARNVGIRSTRARYVAFLAADCLAGSGWVAARLREHRAGADAVAAVLANASPENIASRAAFLLLHHRMSAYAPAASRLLYGLSYDRLLFERFGLFREDLRSGEDTEFNARIAGSARITWSADICTAHRNPQNALALLRDQYARGRRRATAEAMLRGRSRRAAIAIRVLLDTVTSLRAAWRAPDRRERAALLRACTLVPAGAIAYATGALHGPAQSDGGGMRRSQNALGA